MASRGAAPNDDRGGRGGWPWRRRATGAVVVSLLMQLAAVDPPHAAPALARSDLQAAFLVNFTKFVTWPVQAFTSTSAPIVIGVVGEDPFGPALDDAVRGQRVNDRPIAARRAGVRDDLSRFHVLFVGASEARQLEGILERLAGTHVLAVSDIDDFCDAGGSICLVLDRGRVRFEINVGATEARGLRVSTRLLALASRVHKP